MIRGSEKEISGKQKKRFLHSEESGGKKLSRKGSSLELRPLSEGDSKDQSGRRSSAQWFSSHPERCLGARRCWEEG